MVFSLVECWTHLAEKLIKKSSDNDIEEWDEENLMPLSNLGGAGPDLVILVNRFNRVDDPIDKAEVD